MSDKSKEELEDKLFELQVFLSFEKSREDSFCGTRLLELQLQISEVEKQLEEMEKDNDSNI